MKTTKRAHQFTLLRDGKMYERIVDEAELAANNENFETLNS